MKKKEYNMADESTNITEKVLKVSLNETNAKRVNIMKTLLSDEVILLSEKESINYIVNKAVEKYFKSEEIQEKMKQL
jgi:fructose-bisphosphate aldolase class 1